MKTDQKSEAVETDLESFVRSIKPLDGHQQQVQHVPDLPPEHNPGNGVHQDEDSGQDEVEDLAAGTRTLDHLQV